MKGAIDAREPKGFTRSNLHPPMIKMKRHAMILVCMHTFTIISGMNTPVQAIGEGLIHFPSQSLPEEFLHSSSSILDFVPEDLSETLSKWTEPWSLHGEMGDADTADPDTWIKMNHKNLLNALKYPDGPFSKSFYDWWSTQAAKMGQKGNDAFMNAQTEAAAEIALEQPLEHSSLQRIQDRMSFLRSAGREEEAKILNQQFDANKIKASQSAVVSAYLSDPLGHYDQFLQYMYLAGQSGITTHDRVSMGVRFYQLALNKISSNVFHPNAERIMRHWKLFSEKSRTANAIEVDMALWDFETRKMNAFVLGHGLIFPLKITIQGRSIEVLEVYMASSEARVYKARSAMNPQQSLKVKISARSGESLRHHLYETQALRALGRLYAMDTVSLLYVYIPPSGDRLDAYIHQHRPNFGQILQLQEQYVQLLDQFYSKTGFVNTNFLPEHVYRLSDGSLEVDNFETVVLQSTQDPSILAMARHRAQTSFIIQVGEMIALNSVTHPSEVGADVIIMRHIQNLEQAGLYADGLRWRMEYERLFKHEGQEKELSITEPKRETSLDKQDSTTRTKRTKKRPIRFRNQA